MRAEYVLRFEPVEYLYIWSINTNCTVATVILVSNKSSNYEVRYTHQPTMTSLGRTLW